MAGQDRDRATREQVRQPGWHHARGLPCQIVRLNRELGQPRWLKPASNTVHHLVQPILAFNQLTEATTEVGQPTQKAGVDRLVDTDGKDARHPARGCLFQLLQHYVLAGHLAVGDQHDNPIAIGRFTKPSSRLSKRLTHLGSAASLKARQPADGSEAIPVSCRLQILDVAFDHAVKGYHSETVVVTQAVDQPAGSTASRDHFPAAHAARAIQQYHDVTWHEPRFSVDLVRGQRHGQCPGTCRGRRGDLQAAAEYLAGDRETEQEISIESFTGLQADPPRWTGLADD